MSTLLIKNADVLVTMEADREIAGGGLFSRDGVITAVGTTAQLPPTADEVIDARGCVVVPGLVNTHHHMFQNLTRAVPAAQDASLFGWLTALYPIWLGVGPEHIRVSTLIACAELLLSGCTMSSDHLYLYKNGTRIDDEIEAARQIGIRFHATRGGMSIGQSKGGLPPDAAVETEADILRECRRAIEMFHDDAQFAMTRVGVAPCSPFSVSRELMRDCADLARSYGVRLHTHLAENDDDVAYSIERFGARPGVFAESLDWLGDDVWHAHCVKLDAGEIDLFARTGTGVAHCPCSNMRLASGIAPITSMLAHGVKVGLGVDGSASNDGAHLLLEARQAMLLQRVLGDPAAMTARTALEVATIGGARVLGRDDTGTLTPGKAADIAVFDVSGLAATGGWDPVASLVFCGPFAARYTIVNGRVVVRDGELATIDLAATIRRHGELARGLARGEAT